MKKRSNYWQVHLNKKAIKLFRKRKHVSTLDVKLALNMANTASQIYIIQSQPFEKYPEKAKALIEVINNSIQNTIKISNEEKQIRFNKTKRYIK